MVGGYIKNPIKTVRYIHLRIYSNIYIAHLQGIYSETLSVLAYMTLNDVVNGYVQSMIRHSNLKQELQSGLKSMVVVYPSLKYGVVVGSKSSTDGGTLHKIEGRPIIPVSGGSCSGICKSGITTI